MKLTDLAAIKQLKLTRSGELEDLIESFPEEERDGRSDIQLLRDEAEYLCDLYNEKGTRHHRELKTARAILRETKNGKSMPLLLPSFKPKYSQEEIEEYMELTSEYRRLVSLIFRLSKQI